MRPAAQAPIDARYAEMFPVLALSEIGRISRLGERRAYPAGARVFSTGEIAPGAFVLLSGQVDIMQRVGDRDAELIVSHGPGSFMGELAQLSGRPALVDGVARGPVEVLVIPQRRLRDLLVEEAELGERIMRALILRRVALLRSGGGGPIIVGGADNADVLRLEGFLNRNGHPHQRLDPGIDACPNFDRPLSHNAARIANRALSERRNAAQPERSRAGALHWAVGNARTGSDL